MEMQTKKKYGCINTDQILEAKKGLETLEVEKTYTELDNLKAENTKLVEKNTSLTEANSKLFMQIGVEKSGGEKPKHVAPMDLRKLGI